MATGSGIVVWEFENQLHRFEAYEPHVSDFIEQQFSSPPAGATPFSLATVDYSMGAYFIDLRASTQTNTNTGSSRTIRRRIYPQSHPVCHAISWQWQGDYGNWHKYDMEVCDLIETEFSAGSAKVDLGLKIPNFRYVIDFKAMTQCKIDTGFCRPVKRTTHNPFTYKSTMSPPPRSSTFPFSSATAPNLFSSSTSFTFGSPVRFTGATLPTAPQASMGLPAAHASTSFTPAMPLFTPHPMIPSSSGHFHPAPSHTALGTTHLSNGFAPAAMKSGASAASVVPPMAHSNLKRSLNPPIYGGPPPSHYPGSHHKRTKSAQKAISNQSLKLANCSNADEVIKDYVTIVTDPPADENCAICCDSLKHGSGYDDSADSGGSDNDIPLKLQCGHMFHKTCLVALYNSGQKDGSLQCPTCKKIFGVKCGDCPPGQMVQNVVSYSLPGYPDCDTIQIQYHIQQGIQGPEHPNPGQRYKTRGFPRVGYLPNNDKGKLVLKLLEVAWTRRLTFTIGSSVTTGDGDCVVWNEIHHKTEMGSNSSGHGFPDPNYLDNVLAELAVHGVSEDSLGE